MPASIRPLPDSHSRYAADAAAFAGSSEAELGTFEYPPLLTCPITQTLMSDPVVTAAGNVYDRRSIARWLIDHRTDPASGLRLADLSLRPVVSLRGEVEAFRRAVREQGAANRLPPPTPLVSVQPVPSSPRPSTETLPTPFFLPEPPIRPVPPPRDSDLRAWEQFQRDMVAFRNALEHYCPR